MVRSKLLALSLVAAAFAAEAHAQALDGKALFTAKCGICHAATPTGGPPVGPSLYGVVGRAAGGKEGFKYSAALKATGATWNEATLDKYLANPQTFAPGAFMPISLPSADERKAVIGYLKTLGPAVPAPSTTTTKKTTTTASKTVKKPS